MQKETFLSKREQECLIYLSKGLSAKEIAKLVGISNRTVESHINNIKLKVGARRRTDIISYAYLNKLLD